MTLFSPYSERPRSAIACDMRSLSQVFIDLEASVTGESITFAEILDAMHERGFGFLLLVFAFPMALPIPVPPGINVLLATPLLILTAQQAMGRHTIWFPQKIKQRSISKKSLSGMLLPTLPWLKRIEKISKPRLEFMTRGAFSYLIGVCGFIMALSVCVPLPLTNTVPSLGIALMSVGVIMRDGFAVMAGAVIGLAWVLLLCFAVYFFGMEGFEIVKETIKSYI